MLTAGQLLHVLQELVEAFGPDLPITLNGPDEARPTQSCYAGVEEVATLMGYRDRTTPVRLVVLYANAARHYWYDRQEDWP